MHAAKGSLKEILLNNLNPLITLPMHHRMWVRLEKLGQRNGDETVTDMP